jgi:hypothetical protein
VRARVVDPALVECEPDASLWWPPFEVRGATMVPDADKILERDFPVALTVTRWRNIEIVLEFFQPI